MTLSPRVTMAGSVSPGTPDVLLIGLCAFLALIPAWTNYDIISKDGAFQYVPMAQAFLAGGFRDSLFNHPQLPLFPLLMAGVSKASGLSLELSGRLCSYLGHVLAVMGMYLMSSLLFRDRRISLMASLFLMVNPQLMTCSVDCLKESLLLSSIMGGNILIIRGMSAESGKWPLYLAGGFCFALGALLRSTALVFLCSWLAVWAFRKGRGRWGRAALISAPVAGFFAAWMFFPELSLFRKSCYHPGYFFASIHGMADLWESVKDVFLTFFTAGNPGVMLFAVYGLYRREKDWYSCHVLLTGGIFFLILASWIYASGRYYLAPVAWMYPLAAWGVFDAYRSGGRFLRVISVLAVVSCLVLWAHHSFSPPDPDRVAWRQAGTWIQEELGPGREIVSNQDRLVFYAQGKCLPLSSFRPEDSPARILAIDTGDQEGGELDARMRSLGQKPAKSFGRVSVYLPKGLRY